MKRGTFFWCQMGLVLLCCAFLIIPVLQTVLTAFMVNAFKGMSSGFTTAWIHKVILTYGDTIFRSFYLALSVLVVCVVVGVPAAYALVRAGRARWAVLLEESLVLPLSIPGMAIGLGLLLTWGNVSWFRHSWLFLLAGHTIFCLPFMVRSVTAVLRVVPMADYEEAAATLGAGALRRFLQVVVPLAGPGILSGALMVLTLSIGEFNISWMLQTPFTRTLPVGLADSYASMRIEIGSAYTVIFLLLLVPILAIMQRVPDIIRHFNAPRTAPEVLMSTKPIVPASSVPSSLLRAEPVSIRLENCAKTYGSTQVLKPFSLLMPQGKKIVLLGPSGCGKTTTLRIIAGLESPDSGGRVCLGSDDVTNVAVEHRSVGMMFQQYALFPHLTVEENVAYGLKIRGLPDAERRTIVGEMLELVRMNLHAKRRVTSLSGGQRQRVALARALAIRPRVLLLDEPLTALDALLRVSVREELDEVLTRLGITTVIVTHDQEEAMSLGDSIVVMHGGRIVQTGTPQDIYHRPCSAFVAGFVGGSNSMICTLDDTWLHLPGGGKVPRNSVEAAKGLGQGDVTAFFRPEMAELHFEDHPADTPRGHVLASHFLGGKTRISVQMDEETLLKIDLLGEQLSPPSGSSVSVAIKPESLMLFPV